jgi:transposase
MGFPAEVVAATIPGMDDTLFTLPPTEPSQSEELAPGVPRLQLPNRGQLELRSVDLDGLLPADHRARLVWAFVEGLDLGPLYARIKAVEGHPGRPPIDPAILTALWLYATLEGVGSARALDRLCASHDAYRWLAGGVGLNYHTLAAFRVDEADVLDRLLTASVAALLADGLVTMAVVAQDGVRVRAGAGAASYRRRPTLERFLAEAEAQVAALKAELDDDPAATSRRIAAARERAATERASRVRRALEHLPELEAARRRRAKPVIDARASTTDPEAKVMKMADGGYRPAYNVQFAADTKSQVIVGLDVTPAGNDQGQLSPMVRQLRGRYGRAPDALLADAGFLTTAEIDELACRTTLYIPVRTPADPTRDPYRPLPDDSRAVASWRVRMGTAEAKELYKDRAATAECVNAIARNRGLQRFGVRGREKARAISLWFALAHNLMRTVALRAAAAAT